MSTTSPDATEAAAAEQALIAGVPARMVAAWAAHDADAFADLFTEDGALILPGVYKKGRAEIREFMAHAYETHYKDTTVTGRLIDMTRLAPGAVAVLTVGGVLPKGESELSAENAIRASWILVKRDGDWKLAVYQNCPRDTETS
ncbi:SgcJ/EcaC family oxidoreductase [Actinosynnema sp. NPDC023794]